MIRRPSKTQERSSSAPGRKMYGWVALLFFSLCSTAGGAQQGGSAAPPSANEIAKRVDEHYNRLKSLKTGFSEQYDGLGMHRDESGIMFLRKPGKMRWDYSSNQGKVFVLDGKYAWFYTPGDSQVQRIAASQLDDLRSPLRFLLGHTKIENELQGLKVSSAAGGTFLLSGVPKGMQKRIVALSLTVSETGVIHRIEIDEVDGAKTVFNFSHEDPNAVIPENTFHFTAPAGVPVVDALPPV